MAAVQRPEAAAAVAAAAGVEDSPRLPAQGPAAIV